MSQQQPMYRLRNFRSTTYFLLSRIRSASGVNQFKVVAATSGLRPEVATKSLKLKPIRYVNDVLRLGEMIRFWFV